MLRFIAFFKKFRIFLFFALLQIIALTSYFSMVSFARTRFFNSSNLIVGTLLSWERDITKYLYLDDANVRLLEENARLSKNLSVNYVRIDQNTIQINDTVRKLSFERIPATVINSSVQFANNYFTIDAGTHRGLKKNMGVISPNGVVGIVYDVSQHFSIVKSILTKDINIPAYIENNGAFGLLKYNGENPAFIQLTGISNDINIEVGSLVKTRGGSGYFPHGSMIGEIVSFQAIEGKPLWDIKVRLSQDMRKLRYVYGIKNIHKSELDALESNYKILP